MSKVLCVSDRRRLRSEQILQPLAVQMCNVAHAIEPFRRISLRAGGIPRDERCDKCDAVKAPDDVNAQCSFCLAVKKIENILQPTCSVDCNRRTAPFQQTAEMFCSCRAMRTLVCTDCRAKFSAMTASAAAAAAVTTVVAETNTSHVSNALLQEAETLFRRAVHHNLGAAHFGFHRSEAEYCDFCMSLLSTQCFWLRLAGGLQLQEVVVCEHCARELASRESNDLASWQPRMPVDDVERRNREMIGVKGASSASNVVRGITKSENDASVVRGITSANDAFSASAAASSSSSSSPLDDVIRLLAEKKNKNKKDNLVVTSVQSLANQLAKIKQCKCFSLAAADQKSRKTLTEQLGGHRGWDSEFSQEQRDALDFVRFNMKRRKFGNGDEFKDYFDEQGNLFFEQFEESQT